MQIPQKYRKFDDPSLVIVAARRQAQIYFAYDRTIELIDQIIANPPRYSDREGFFAQRGAGRVIGTGSVYERRKEKMEHEFVPIFVAAIKQAMAETRATNLSLFLPSYQIQFILPALPKNIADKIRAIIKHNYYNRHPIDVLKKLEKHTAKPATKPEKEEVIKLLNYGKLRPSQV